MFAGIWGPYKDALLPDFYLHEGGQSATGYLLDYIVKNHPAYKQALEDAGKMYFLRLSFKFDASIFQKSQHEISFQACFRVS